MEWGLWLLGVAILLAALGFAACLTGALLLLPPLLVRFLRVRGSQTAARAPRTLGVRASVSFALRHPWGVLVASLTVAVGGLGWLALRPVTLEDDLRNAGATWVDEPVQVCTGGPNTLVTSRKPDDLAAFNETFVAEFAVAGRRMADLAQQGSGA